MKKLTNVLFIAILFPIVIAEFLKGDNPKTFAFLTVACLALAFTHPVWLLTAALMGSCFVRARRAAK